jgi:hypothetical protein
MGITGGNGGMPVVIDLRLVISGYIQDEQSIHP